jgi:hypothetical protein
LRNLIAEREDPCLLGRVAKLAHEEAMTPGQKQLRVAARYCLAAMPRENTRERQARLLPRASDANTVPTPDKLLRPAADRNTASASDQLLRASDSDAPF